MLFAFFVTEKEILIKKHPFDVEGKDLLRLTGSRTRRRRAPVDDVSPELFPRRLGYWGPPVRVHATREGVGPSVDGGRSTDT